MLTRRNKSMSLTGPSFDDIGIAVFGRFGETLLRFDGSTSLGLSLLRLDSLGFHFWCRFFGSLFCFAFASLGRLLLSTRPRQYCSKLGSRKDSKGGSLRTAGLFVSCRGAVFRVCGLEMRSLPRCCWLLAAVKVPRFPLVVDSSGLARSGRNGWMVSASCRLVGTVFCLGLPVPGVLCCPWHFVTVSVLGMLCCLWHFVTVSVLGMLCCPWHFVTVSVLGILCCTSHTVTTSVLWAFCCL